MLYKAHQVRWLDGNGTHAATLDGPKSYEGAVVIALGIGRIMSGSTVEIWEVGDKQCSPMAAGPYFKLLRTIEPKA